MAAAFVLPRQRRKVWLKRMDENAKIWKLVCGPQPFEATSLSLSLSLPSSLFYVLCSVLFKRSHHIFAYHHGLTHQPYQNWKSSPFSYSLSLLDWCVTASGLTEAGERHKRQPAKNYQTERTIPSSRLRKTPSWPPIKCSSSAWFCSSL